MDRKEEDTEEQYLPVSFLPTGIPGYDYIANGGLPKGRSTLLSGYSGS